jgi:hypothetical protein
MTYVYGLLKFPKCRIKFIVSQFIIIYKTIICTTHDVKVMKVYIYIYIYIYTFKAFIYIYHNHIFRFCSVKNYYNMDKLSVDVPIKVAQMTWSDAV